GGSSRTQDRGEPAKYIRLPSFPRQEAGLGERCGGAIGLEDTVRRGAAGVHDTLGDPFVVEMSDLLPQMEVLEQRGTPLPCLERMVGVRQPQTLGSGQVLTGLGRRIEVCDLAVGLAPRARW